MRSCVCACTLLSLIEVFFGLHRIGCAERKCRMPNSQQKVANFQKEVSSIQSHSRKVSSSICVTKSSGAYCDISCLQQHFIGRKVSSAGNRRLTKWQTIQRRRSKSVSHSHLLSIANYEAVAHYSVQATTQSLRIKDVCSSVEPCSVCDRSGFDA